LFRDDDSLLLRAKNKRLKDDRLAADLGLSTLDQQMVVQTGMDEFQDFLSKRQFTEEQQHQIRDIRRRGKNKVAAQNCRKRKLDQLDDLQASVNEQKQEQAKEGQINKQLKEELRAYMEELDKIVPDFSAVSSTGSLEVGLPASHEHLREQFNKLSPKERPKIFCHDCKPLTRKCFYTCEIGVY